jgi:thymidylate synthase ThyX
MCNQELEGCDILEVGSLWFWINPDNVVLMNNMTKEFVLNTVIDKYPNVASSFNLVPYDSNYEGYIHYLTSDYFFDEWVSEDSFNLSKFIYLTFRVTAPQAIKIHMYKHKYGFVESEVSRRYVKSDLEFIGGFDWYNNLDYLDVDVWREGSDNIKQGSSSEAAENQQLLNNLYYEFCIESNKLYKKFIHEYKVAPEQARFVQLMGSMTTFYWTANVSDLRRFYLQRLDPNAQKEIRFIANLIGGYICDKYPATWNKLISQ